MNNPYSSMMIGVVGAGAMGGGIAQVAASAGHQVLLFDAFEGAAAKGIERIRAGLAGLVKRGKMTEEQVDELVGRITPVEGLSDLASAELVVEAIVENLEVKQKLFADLEQVCAETAILATNTSSISVTAIGAALQRPEQLVGMHFFNPAPILKLVEVISGLATDRAVADKVYALSEAWGKLPVHARSTPGFIVNRVARPFYAEALRVYEEGAADFATVDAVLKESGGFRMGPFELMDLIGNDVNYSVTCSVFNAYYQDPRFLPSTVQREYVDGGLLGRKSGQGFYDYREGAVGVEPATADAVAFSQPVVIEGGLGVADPLADLIAGAGIEVVRKEGSGLIKVGNATLALTDGRMATQRAQDEGIENLVLFDLALDFATASRIAIAAADGCEPAAVDSVVGLFQRLDRRVSIIDDIPGLIVMRTVSMLANEAADAVNLGVCDVQGCDTAMRAGVNYPRGPLAWADAIGLANTVVVLDHLAALYGLDRYRVSPLLRRKSVSGGTFYSSDSAQ